MNLAFTIAGLQAGVAERVLSTLANSWAQKGWSVSILTGDHTLLSPFYELHQNVKQVPLNGPHSSKASALSNNMRLIHATRREIIRSKPDCVISFVDATNVRTLIATRGLNIPVIVSERTNPAAYKMPRIWQTLRTATYPFCDALVVQTERTRSYFARNGLKRIVVIPNPVLGPRRSEVSAIQPSGRRKIITMGRLVPEKRLDLLLRAFLEVRKEIDCSLTVLGDGPLRGELLALRDQLELTQRVEFLGLLRDPLPLLRDADLFVLSSEFEGMPNALLEAMSCGLPAVSFDCPTGPREIIRHGVDGVLVPPLDIEALAKAMKRLLLDERERQMLGSKAAEVNERFSLNRIMSMWEDLLASVRGQELNL